MVNIKRIYEDSSNNDGYRILVDRLWPRGIAKDKANLDSWYKEIAPSSNLRKWFHRDPEKWEAFKTHYQKELKEKNDLLHELKALEKKHGMITLLFASKAKNQNHALVLKELLEQLD